MDANGGDVGLLNQGTSWTDYTDTFDTQIVSNQAGWVVRGQDANDGYVFILNADNDTAGTPDTLQELDLHGGTYTSVGSVALGTSLAPDTWHTVTTTVSGTTITVSLDGQQIASLSSSSFPSGTTAYPAGTVGFREYSGEEADFRDLSVTSSSGATLYSSPLNAASDLADFAAPGTNSVPSILDGAKRDRAVWVGDMNVEGPTVYYSTDQSAVREGRPAAARQLPAVQRLRHRRRAAAGPRCTPAPTRAEPPAPTPPRTRRTGCSASARTTSTPATPRSCSRNGRSSRPNWPGTPPSSTRAGCSSPTAVTAPTGTTTTATRPARSPSTTSSITRPCWTGRCWPPPRARPRRRPPTRQRPRRSGPRSTPTCSTPRPACTTSATRRRPASPRTPTRWPCCTAWRPRPTTHRSSRH